MSYYYKYKFISPEGIYAIVKEELKSYFDTGAIDDLMFPTYTKKCLEKLGNTSYPIAQDILFIEDFEARLPDNFYAVREAWMCIELEGPTHQFSNSFYSQTATTTIQIAPMTVNGSDCTNPDCSDPSCEGCQPEVVKAVYKTNTQMPGRSFKRMYLLKPGNISPDRTCDVNYVSDWELYSGTSSISTGSSTFDSFDVRGNKFVTNFRKGKVNLVFYSQDYDDVGNQMIPDNYRVKEFIEAFIKYKVFETLTNQVYDETFNQLQQKMFNYRQMADEAFVLADVEVRKQTIYQKQRKIKRQLDRLNRYELPSSLGRTKWTRRTSY